MIWVDIMKVTFDEDYVSKIAVDIIGHDRYIPRWIFAIVKCYHENAEMEREVVLDRIPIVKKSNKLKMQKLDDDLSNLEYPDTYNLLGKESLDFVEHYPQWREIIKEVEFGTDPEEPECLKKNKI